MPYLDHDHLQFHYRETGTGIPFLFQHGLGGNIEQTFGLFEPPEGVRMIGIDCRGHGKTLPLGDPQRISIATFAEDLIALLDMLQIEQAITGGISMGAAVTLNLTLRFSHRVIGLVQSRPAWLAAPNPRNTRWFGEIAQLIREHGAEEGAVRFRNSTTYQEVLRESPAVAQSMLGQFDNPRAEATVTLLEQLRADKPCADLDDLKQIAVPTLVLANRLDPVHPFEYGQAIADAISGAEFGELTAKSVSLERHQHDLQEQLDRFLRQHFL